MSHSTETIDIVTCGEAMGLFSAQTDGSLREAEHYVRAAAGAELNVATGLARLFVSATSAAWGMTPSATGCARSWPVTALITGIPRKTTNTPPA